MTPQELWAQFTAVHPMEQDGYEAWAFGADPDGLAALVLRGEKTGTSSAYDLYQLEESRCPSRGNTTCCSTAGRKLSVICGRPRSM